MSESNARRQLVLQHRLMQDSRGSGQVGAFGWFRQVHVSRMELLFALLFWALLLVPIALGTYPVPYRLGGIATTDVYPRVHFQWIEPEREKKELSAIRANHAKIYRAKTQWLEQIKSGTWELIDEAATRTPEQLLAIAQKRRLQLSPEAAAILHTALQDPRMKDDRFVAVIAPLGEVLNTLIQQGIIRRKDLERDLGQRIRVVYDDGTQREVVLTDGQAVPVTGAASGQGAGQSGAGPARPYLLSEVPEALELALGQSLPRTSRELRGVLKSMILAELQPSLLYDHDATQDDLTNAEAQATKTLREVVAGPEAKPLLRKGEKISLVALKKLYAEEAAYRLSQPLNLQVQRFGGKAVLLLLVVVAFLFSFAAIVGEHQKRTLFGMGIWVLTLVFYLTACGWIWLGLPATLAPIGFVIGFVVLAMSSRLALIVAPCCVLLLLVLTEGALGVMIGLLASSWFFVAEVHSVRHSLKLLNASLGSALLGGLAILAYSLTLGEDPLESLSVEYMSDGRLFQIVCILLSWVVSALLLMLSLSLPERLFGATTQIRLQSLLDHKHQILDDMEREAPGTSNHSIMVGNLCEAVGEALGANVLLLKIGARFHDIGKLQRPGYFAENELGVSRHDSLSPAMSTLIIVGHVQDGSWMAKEFGLPPAIIDLIEQHHGTDLIRYFFYKAKKQAREGETVDAEQFRYPGPKPQSREAAIMMMVDGVEAASRTLDRPDNANIRKLVHAMITERLLDGQFDESGMTLVEIRRAEEIMVSTLTAMYHARVKYPGQAKAARRPRRATTSV